MSGHTPWFASESSDYLKSGAKGKPAQVVRELSGRGRVVAIITRNDQDKDFARLIASAPDLLEALESIRVFAQDCIENGHDRGALGNLFSIRDLCDRNIAKARGEA